MQNLLVNACQRVAQFAWSEPFLGKGQFIPYVRNGPAAKYNLTFGADSTVRIGQMAVLCGAAVGVGALAYYGLGICTDSAALDHLASGLWSADAKEKARLIYMYLGGSLAISSFSAKFVQRTPELFALSSSGGVLILALTLGILVRSGRIVRVVPNNAGAVVKRRIWIGYSIILGALMAPVGRLEPGIVWRAVTASHVVFIGVTAIAFTAPSQKFLSLRNPLKYCYVVMFVSSFGAMVMSPSTTVGAVCLSTSVFGGLLVFPLFLLFDTQTIISVVEGNSLNSGRSPDPIYMSLLLLLDVVSIFMRMVIALPPA